MDDELLTTKQVAEYLKLPPSTLYDWRTARRPCPPAMRIGRHLRWRRSDVDAWLRAQGQQ